MENNERENDNFLKDKSNIFCFLIGLILLVIGFILGVLIRIPLIVKLKKAEKNNILFQEILIKHQAEINELKGLKNYVDKLKYENQLLKIALEVKKGTCEEIKNEN